MLRGWILRVLTIKRDRKGEGKEERKGREGRREGKGDHKKGQEGRGKWGKEGRRERKGEGK